MIPAKFVVDDGAARYSCRMERKGYRILLAGLTIICLNALFCQDEEKPEVKEKWSDEPYVDSALTYHFAVLQKVLETQPGTAYSLDTLTISALFFEELTGAEISGTLSPVGVMYQGQELSDDYQKWWSWCQANKDRLVWDTASAEILLRPDSAEIDDEQP